MKKLVFSLVVYLLGLCSVFLIASPTLAADPHLNVIDTLSDYTASNSATHTISFTISTQLKSAGKIQIDFPSFNILSSTFAYVTVNGTLASFSPSAPTGQTISLTNTGTDINIGSAIIIQLNNIYNPATPGSYFITVKTTSPGDIATNSAPFSIVPSPVTTLRVEGFPSPAMEGASNQFTVTAVDSGGTTITSYTGTIHFTSSDPSVILPADYTFVADDQGTHTFSATLNTGGIQSITATDTVNTSITGTQSGIAVMIPSSVQVTSSNGSSVYGEAVIFTANVTTGATGAVQFKVDNVNTGIAVDLIAGIAISQPIDNLSTGNHSVTAHYSGDSTFVASDSAPITQVVNQASTTTILTAFDNPSTYGESVTFTASVSAVSPSAGTPTGTITFQDGAINLGSGALTGGQAMLTISNLTAGTHSISAVYNGDANFLTSSGALSGNLTINPKTLTPVITVADKEYDGTTWANVTGSSLNGVIASDDVTLTWSAASFESAGAGTGKIVNISGLNLSGTAAGNYVLSTDSISPTANIIPKTLTISGITANNKEYDGTITATVDPGNATLIGKVSGDDVSLNTTGATWTFADKHAGTDKTVSASGLTLTGTAAGNYTVSSTASTTASIIPRPLTITAVTDSKLYDGNDSSFGVPQITGELAAGDIPGFSQAFDNKNVGNGNKTLSVSGAIADGNSGNNYAITFINNNTGTITAKNLTISGGISADNKVYDGTSTATVNTSGASFAGLIPGDIVTLNYASANFSDKNAGTTKIVTVSGLTLGGIDAGNYLLSDLSATALADVTPLGITGTVTVSNKVYDNTTAATITDRSLSGVIGTDMISLTGGTANFVTENAGSGITVNISGLSLSGTDAPNYTISSTATTTADISKAPLSIGGGITASNKTYDGSSTATVNTSGVSFTGLISGDSVTLNHTSASFSDKNAGTAKTVTVSGLSLGGIDAGNYLLTDITVTALADIIPFGITGTVIVSNKIYDGTNSAIITSRSLTGVIGADIVSLTGGTANFETINAGAGITVNISGLSLSGADAPNYSISSTATTAADITKAPLSIGGGITASNKTYDGSDSATVNTSGVNFNELISGDIVTLNYTSASFSDKNAGDSKTVTLNGLTLSGADSGNYSLSSTITTVLADITPLGITGTVTVSNKVYDNTSAAAISSRTLSGVIGADIVSLTGGTATFVTEHAGNGIIVNITGLSLSGVDAPNYTISSTATATADISKATPVITWADPAYIIYPAALSVTQLNATASVPGVFPVVSGNFTYDPALGVVLDIGNGHDLHVTFVPDDTGNFNNASAGVHINVLSGNRLVFTSGAQSITAGIASGIISIQLQDNNANPVNAVTPLSINLSSSSASGRFDFLSTGPFDGSIISITINPGTSSADFYYRDTLAGTAIITVSSPGIINGSQPETITAAAIDQYLVSTISSPRTTGAAFNVTLQARDAYGNNVSNLNEIVNLSFGQPDAGAIPQSVNLSGGNASFNLTLTAASTNQTVTFSGASSGKSATSNSFVVNAASIGGGGIGGGLGGGGSSGGVGGGGDAGDRQYLNSYMSVTPGTFSQDVTIKAYDGLCNLILPAGTIGKTAEGWALSYIIIEPITKENQKVPPPAGGNIVGLTYNLGPEGTTFDPPVTISLLYDRTRIPAGVSEENLVLGIWDPDGKQWLPLNGCRVDTANHTITAPLSHFSTYAIISLPPRQPSFSLANLLVSPGTLNPGQKITVSAVLANNGEAAGDYTVSFGIDGKTIDTRTVSLGAKSNQTISFESASQSPGTHAVTINGLSGSFIVSAPVTIPVPVPENKPDWKISDLNIFPQEAKPGEKIQITARVNNQSNTQAEYKANLLVNNRIVESQTLSLAGLTTGLVSFTTSSDIAGTYRVEIEGASGSFTVKSPPAVATFSLGSLKVNPEQAQTGKAIKVTGQVTNSGDLPGEFSVTLKVNGVDWSSRTIALDGKASQEVAFNLTLEEGGTYEIQVNGLAASLLVRRPLFGTWLYGVILIGILLLILTAYWVVRRGKRLQDFGY